jgi:ATP adenylyltransferase
MVRFRAMHGDDSAPAPEPDDPPIGAGQGRHHDLERLWTPWRMRYVGGGAAEAGCLFCSRLADDDDVASLIVYRGDLAFVIMNLFPYNTGHVMLVPNQHVASPETADPAALAALTALAPPTLRALRRCLACDGFNLGLNIGAVAGAGVTDHLHQHVVPRWLGDANFMPILAATMVLPELIPITYAKVRAELERELSGRADTAVVALAADGRRVLTISDGRLPIARAAPTEPLWRAARRTVDDLGGGPADVIGWAGPNRTGATTPALALRLGHPAAGSRVDLADGAAWLTIDEARQGPDGAMVSATVARLAASGVVG